jgi:hypothetical protein
MRPVPGCIWLTAALAGSCLLGCQGLGRHAPYPPDPIFVLKKPVEAKAEKAAPAAVVAAEPEPPAVPPAVVAARQAPRNQPAVPSAPPGQPEDYRVGYPPTKRDW